MRFAQFFLTCCLLSLLGIVCYARQDDRADANQEMLTKLKRNRADTAKECFKVTKVAYDAGTITLDLVLTAAEKQRDAELAVADGRGPKLKVLRDHLHRVKKIKDQIQALQLAQVRGGEDEKLLFSELAYQDAEIDLLTAMIAPRQGE